MFQCWLCDLSRYDAEDLKGGVGLSMLRYAQTEELPEQLRETFADCVPDFFYHPDVFGGSVEQVLAAPAVPGGGAGLERGWGRF